jgi:hypothetical protein
MLAKLTPMLRHGLGRPAMIAESRRKTTYVTKAVKHFEWEPRGKRRLHKKPFACASSAVSG